MNYKILSISIFSISLISCSSQMIISRDAPITKVKMGTSYYLPKRLHKLTLTKTLEIKNNSDAEKKIANKVNIKNEANKAKIKFEELRGVGKLTPSGKGKDSAIKEAHISEGKYKYMENMSAIADKGAASALEKLKETEEKNCIYKISMKVEQLALVPDERYSYIAQLNHSYFRSDDFKINTTTSGLLSSAFAEGEDKTGDIIVAIAKTIAIAFGGFTPPTIPPLNMLLDPPKDTDKTCKSNTIKNVGIVDLSKKDEVNNFVTLFTKDVGLPKLNDLKLSVSGYGVHINDNLDLNKYDEDKHCSLYKGKAICPIKDKKIIGYDYKDFYSGLFYRRELPYVIKLEGEKIFDTALIFMPNASPISKVDFKAGMFVTSKHDVTFENGMLTSKSSNRPSEALGLVSIPLDVAKGVVGVLTEFIQLKINYVSNNETLATKEKALIEALQALKEVSEKKSSTSDKELVQ